ncbi:MULTISPECIES: YchJ family protein [Arthrobacter]|uniref:UPF0225 protein AAC385_04900 n=2 Tax=Arthrobacter TaxID=1663 RepID=A0ABU9KIT8_9MICC|nr:YchJ family protein [Arthrobacter sp. YJM1]MDP5226493.1 YchJ family protein [Arthrobacter sp. YJM1]
MSLPDTPENCPCLSGERYVSCCGRYHEGEAVAPTAEALMRSRYSAFAVGDTAYLLATWHPGTRPSSLELDARVSWVRLDILAAEAGGPFDTEGQVAFRAHYRVGARRGVLEELGRFVRQDGRWFYVDGDVVE